MEDRGTDSPLNGQGAGVAVPPAMPGQITLTLGAGVPQALRVVEAQFFSMDDVARMLHVHRQKVREWAMDEEDPMPFVMLPHMTKGAFITLEGLQSWVDRRAVLYRDRQNRHRAV